MRLFAAAMPDLGRLPAQLPEGALVVVAPSGEAWEEQLGRAGELARSRALWVVVAGPRREGEGWRLSAACLSPEGRPVAVQDELFPPQGWRAGGRLELFELAGWPAALLVGEDVLWPEVARLATLEGARLLAVPSLYPPEEAGGAPTGPWRQLAGGWQEVQQNQVFAVESPLDGELAGRRSHGRAAVWAPCEITPDSRGWLDWAEKPGEAAAAWLEEEALEGIRDAYPLERFLNPALYRRRLAEAYERLAGEAGAGAAGGGER